MHLSPDSGSMGEFGLHEAHEQHKGPERHSAKAHRCVEKVMAQGHDESSAWAICTTSIGKEGVYAKGHGGSASPKRRTKEADPLDTEFEQIIREHNDCHHPPGSPEGGQFCSKGGSRRDTMGVYQKDEYDAAYDHARSDATKFGRPMGIEKANEYGKTVFRVKHIPADPNKRFGWETRVEVVEPGSPKTQKVSDYLPSYKKPLADIKKSATGPAPDAFRDSSLSDIARVIQRDWSKQGKGVNYAAKPYLDALSSMDKVTDNYGADSGESIVAYFLGNARSWKGPTAKVVKAELQKRLKRGR